MQGSLNNDIGTGLEDDALERAAKAQRDAAAAAAAAAAASAPPAPLGIRPSTTGGVRPPAAPLGIRPSTTGGVRPPAPASVGPGPIVNSAAAPQSVGPSPIVNSAAPVLNSAPGESRPNVLQDAIQRVRDREAAAAAAAAAKEADNPFAGMDFSAAANVNLSDVDLQAIREDPNARRLAGQRPGQRDNVQELIDAGIFEGNGFDSLGLPIQRREDRSNPGTAANIALGIEEPLGDLVYNEATNSFIHENRPLGVTPQTGVTNQPAGTAGPTAAQFAEEAANIGGISLGNGMGGQGTSGDLEGFNPGQNVSNLSDQQLQDMEDAARANDLRDLSDLREANLADLVPDRAEEEARRLESEATAGGLSETLIDKIASDGQATPEQLARIKEVADRQIEQSGSDINAQLQRTLSQLREESGGSRGLRFTDTPIFNQAQEVSNEAGRLQSQSINQARAAQSAAELNLPLQQQQADFQAGQLALQGQTLEQQLAQQAFNNRALLFGQSTGFGLDLLNASPSAKEFSLGQQSLDNQDDQTSQARRDRISQQQQQNVLGLITGGAAIFSDRAMKVNISEMSISELAEAFNKLPISTWQYDEAHGLGTETHIGAMAQDLQEHLGIGNGKVVTAVDQIGIMTAVGKLAAATISKES